MSPFLRPPFRLAVAPLGLGLLVLAACPGEPDEPPALAEGIYAPLGEIRPDATEEQRATFERGREVALRRFTPEQGLGPTMNVTFCGISAVTISAVVVQKIARRRCNRFGGMATASLHGKYKNQPEKSFHHVVVGTAEAIRTFRCCLNGRDHDCYLSVKMENALNLSVPLALPV